MTFEIFIDDYNFRDLTGLIKYRSLYMQLQIKYGIVYIEDRCEFYDFEEIELAQELINSGIPRRHINIIQYI